MTTIKSIFKNKMTSIFLILAFTLSIITFLIAITIISNQKEEMKKYNIENNKEITIISKDKIKIDSIKEIALKNKVTMNLKYFDDVNEFYISTNLVNNSFSQQEKFISGHSFSQEENESNEYIGLVSAMLANNKEEFLIKSHGDNIKLDIQGVFNDTGKNLIIPNKLFYKMLGSENINEVYVRPIISGEIEDIEKTINSLNQYLVSLDSSNKIEVFDYMKEDRTAEVNSFKDAYKIIILITIINSVGLTALWVSSRKKELAIRKAVGAVDSDLSNLYFKELLVIGLISIILSTTIYCVVLSITGGYFKGFNIQFNIIALLKSIFLVYVTAFIVSIPSVAYLSKLNPATLLRED